ncbi:hypothetical protein GCM10007416_33940 [Kroppenstedtia guangzhouensis]|uniref:TcpE family protein n=1 Tax=Kroppenstedtia guangzhouensis TaxID=1274356 RepID=A0ABQ1H4Z3_9BACL|nr:hypothetical protein [Kroppenstedtia guangzhouensis]GGA57951.1 hypothetical protein GCM10007416_33940 [Kroppenstedtia guangzhouensis]
MRELDTYTEVLKVKRLFRHLEGIPIPLPFPATTTALVAGILLEVVMFKWVPYGNPLIKYVIIPLGTASFISYYEPEGINLFQQAYRQVRRRLRPRRRVVNRAVSLKGMRKQYPHMTYIHRN